MRRQILTPEGVAPPAGQYSHAVMVEGASRMLYVAGQVPYNEAGELVGEGDPTAQAEQVFVNLRRVIESAGGRLEDTVKTTTFLVDLAHRQPLGEVRARQFPDGPPANSLLVVASLAHPLILVEIEAIVPLA